MRARALTVCRPSAPCPPAICRPDADCSASASADNIPAPSPDAPRFALPDLSHFPFGHGLGQEELLLLGLILLLLYEGRAGGGDADSDLFLTLTLLGFLLVCG